MKCKLCTAKKTARKKGKWWDEWQICANCFKEIKTSTLFARATILVSKYCLFDLKDVNSIAESTTPFCNEICRSKFYRREAKKKKGIANWISMSQNTLSNNGSEGNQIE